MASGRPSTFRAVAFVGDVAIAAASLGAAFFLRRHVAIPGTLALLPAESVRFTAGNIAIVAAVQAFALSFFGLYRDHERFREPLVRLLLPALFVELLSLAAIYFLAQPYSFPRSVLVIFIVLNGALLGLWRSALDRLFPQPRRRAMIVGGGPAATLVADTIRRHPWTGVELVGVLGPPGQDEGHGLPILGPLDRLVEIAQRERIDEVILMPEAPSWRDRLPEKIPDGFAADILVWPSPFETMIGRLRFRIVGDLPLLEARVRPLGGTAAFAKRAFDVAASGAALVLLAPGLLLAAVLVGTTSRGGMFYRQTRIGRDGRSFELWKLRTMREGAEVETGAVLAVPDDPRVTSIGRTLRAARIDEIPQLWNVLRGDMSLVGPRPIRPRFFVELVEELPAYWQRLVVRPGLTGFAQVRRGYETSMAEKLAHDLEWIADRSVRLYLRTLTTTAWRVLGQFARGLSGRSR